MVAQLYFIKLGNEKRGPFTEAQIRSMWSHGLLTADYLFTAEGIDYWEPVSTLCESSSELSVPTSRPARLQTKNSYSISKPVGYFIIVVAAAIIAYFWFTTEGFQRSYQLSHLSNGSREAPLSIPYNEISKITFVNGNFFEGLELYNGSDWTLTRVDVSITRTPKGQASETRRFQLTIPEPTPDPYASAQKKVDQVAKPYANAIFFSLAAGRFVIIVDHKGAEPEFPEMAWAIVDAYGFKR